MNYSYEYTKSEFLNKKAAPLQGRLFQKLEIYSI